VNVNTLNKINDRKGTNDQLFYHQKATISKEVVKLYLFPT